MDIKIDEESSWNWMSNTLNQPQVQRTSPQEEETIIDEEEI